MERSRLLIVAVGLLWAIGCSGAGGTADAILLADDSPAPTPEDPSLAIPSGSFRIVEPLTTSRSHHTATPLPGGKILITGGHDGFGFLASAEVYDPVRGSFEPTGPMWERRAYHSAVRISGRDGFVGTADDLVIVAGGFDGEAVLTSVEVYYPDEGRFARLPRPLPQPLYRHGAVPVAGPYDENGRLIQYLPTGNQVLLVGGATDTPGGGTVATNSAFLYTYDPEHPNSSLCAIAAAPAFARVGHTATAFVGPDGVLGSRVLIYGGEGAPADLTDGAYQVLAAPEIYDLKENGWIQLTPGPLAAPRTDHRAVQLAGNEILLVGGYGGVEEAPLLDVATIFRPDSREISASTFLAVPGSGNVRQSPEITLLDRGAVLITGGYDGQDREVLSSVEVFFPDEFGGELHTLDGMSRARVHHTATRTAGQDGIFGTRDDEVIICGGKGNDSSPLRETEAFGRR